MGSMDEFTRNTMALTPRFRGGVLQPVKKVPGAVLDDPGILSILELRMGV